MTAYVPFYGAHPTPEAKGTPGVHVQARQKCCICGGRPCLRAVGRDGYCVDHIPEAFKAAKDIKEGAR